MNQCVTSIIRYVTTMDKSEPLHNKHRLVSYRHGKVRPIAHCCVITMEINTNQLNHLLEITYIEVLRTHDIFG